MARLTSFAELHALVLTRLGRDVAARVLNDIVKSNVTIVRVSEDDEDRAREIIDQYADKAFSYTDATSFAVMDRLGIKYAFAFDRHFRQYCFTTLDQLG